MITEISLNFSTFLKERYKTDADIKITKKIKLLDGTKDKFNLF